MISRRDYIASNLTDVIERISVSARAIGSAPTHIVLIAVTKTYPVTDVEILKGLGVLNFGENRGEEGLRKSAQVQGIWHFQGQVQSKKLGAIASWADVIHSLDDASHINKLDQCLSRMNESEGAGKRIGVFLQLSLDGADGRGGLTENFLEPLAVSVLSTSHLDLLGIMCVPPVEMEATQAFTAIQEAHGKFTEKFPAARFLSAGMSGDFEVAITHGATHVRVGSSILGMRGLHH